MVDDEQAMTRQVAVALFALAFAAGAPVPAEAAKRRTPRLEIVQAPPARTDARSATFAFRVDRGRAWCRLDRGPLRRCRRAVTYRRLPAGPHVFSVTARRGAHRVTRRTRWVVATGEGAGAAPAPAFPSAYQTLVFEDHFSGSAVDTGSWSPWYSAGHAGNGLRRPSAMSVAGGNLVVTAQMVDGVLVSGGMSLKQPFTYGRYEFRVRTEADPSATMSGVVLTWPTDGNWPASGENDIYETGPDPDRTPFHTFIHYDATNKQYHYAHQADGKQWHTMVMDWSPTALKIYRDGALVWTLTDTAAIPDVAHKLCIQLDARYNRALPAPTRMYVDYVRIYR